MKKLFLSLLVLPGLGLLAGAPVHSQTSKIATGQQAQLESANRKLADGFVRGDVAPIMALYLPDATCMPEYQPTLRGAEAIKTYYQQLMKRQQTTSFARCIVEIIPLNNQLAEIGTFTRTATAGPGGLPVRFSGKYFNIWQTQPNGTLRLKAESYGYFTSIEAPASLIVKTLVSAGKGRRAAVFGADQKLLAELRARNALMETAVRNRDGNLRADFFTEDAVFMPFADSLKVGAKAIRNHLIKYNSGDVVIDSIRISSAYAEALDGYVLEYPEFYVQWHAPGLAGTGQGKGIRLWRRMPGGTLKLYREIGLHDQLE